MRTHEYTVAAGKDVPAKFTGAKIVHEVPTTLSEAIPRFFADEASLVSAAVQHRNIDVNRKVRATLGRAAKAATADTPAVAEGTIEEAIRNGQAFVYKMRVVDPNAPKKSAGSGEIKAAKAVVAKVNASVTKASKNDLQVLVKLGQITTEQAQAELARRADMTQEQREAELAALAG